MATKPDADPKLTRRQAENARAAIQVGKIINKFQRFMEDEEEHKLSANQIKAGTVLLNKCLPDQQKVETEETHQPMPLEQIQEQLVEMIAGDPELLQKAIKKAGENSAPALKVVNKD